MDLSQQVSHCELAWSPFTYKLRLALVHGDSPDNKNPIISLLNVLQADPALGTSQSLSSTPIAKANTSIYSLSDVPECVTIGNTQCQGAALCRAEMIWWL